MIVASISGGKDSAALSLHLKELGLPHRRVFMDTGWEHPATYNYLRGELTRVIGPIEEISGPKKMEDLVRHKGMFPSMLRRFCTQELKVFPMQKYLAALIDAGEEVVNAVGIRAAESEARSKMAEREWSETFDCEVWRPLIAWTEAQVIAIHQRHGLKPNPLYLLGASRVGCWPCIFARKQEIRLIADIDPDRIDRIRKLEADVTAAAKARREQQGKPEMGAPAWFQSQRRDGDTNQRPCIPIDEVVEWSRTSRGGTQYEMFAAAGREAGCVRWGMCETDEP